jgi:hypothetical protein
MEIHKPKAWHGWRELAKEVGVIVIGIAIALSGEQAIEWLHRRAEVDEAREALRAEIADNAGRARVVLGQERCLGALMDRVIAWGNGAPRPERPIGLRPFGIPTPSRSTWEVDRAGAVAHMPLPESLAYARFYDGVDADVNNAGLEIAALQRLAGQAAKARPGPADLQRAVEDAAQVRSIGSIRVREALARVEAAKAMGVNPTPPSAQQREDLAGLCNFVGMAPTLESLW